MELGGNHFRIIACHAVNLQGVEPVALLVVLHTALDGGLVLPDTGDDVIVACPVRQESFSLMRDSPLPAGRPCAPLPCKQSASPTVPCRAGRYFRKAPLRTLRKVCLLLVHASLVDGTATHVVLLELGDEKLLVVKAG